MTWQMAIVSYFSLWWVVIFIFLPMGVKKEENPGKLHYPAAPKFPHLWPKIIATTIVTGLIVYGIHWMIINEVVQLKDL